jgi:hypothetical protein
VRQAVDFALQVLALSSCFFGTAGGTGRANLAAHRCSNFLWRSRGMSRITHLRVRGPAPELLPQRARRSKGPKWCRGESASAGHAMGSDWPALRSLQIGTAPAILSGPAIDTSPERGTVWSPGTRLENGRSGAHIPEMETIVRCGNCGAEYRRTEEKFLVPHTGHASCTVCGNTLEYWVENNSSWSSGQRESLNSHPKRPRGLQPDR